MRTQENDKARFSLSLRNFSINVSAIIKTLFLNNAEFSDADLYSFFFFLGLQYWWSAIQGVNSHFAREVDIA